MKLDIETKKILQEDNKYPPLLKEIKNPPAQIFIKGTMPPWENLCVAIVGTRKPTEEGKMLARKVSFELAQRGFVIVSGLALGIDAEAHKGALDAHGKTIAVLANGLDIVYPLYHKKLSEDILQKGGSIISEYPQGEKPLPYRFLERNRIISGLSVATIVIEAPRRSGALSTAYSALDQGREVFVFPGEITNKNYEGSHRLIRDGARLVTNVFDILEDLSPLLQNYGYTLPFIEKQKEVLDEKELLIIELLKKEKMASLDKLAEITNLDLQDLSEKVTMLIIDGKIEEINGFLKVKKV